jgi:hypothetical protein
MWWNHLPASVAFCDVETTGLGNDDRIAIKRDKIGASTSIRRSSFPRQRRCFKSNCARKDRRPGDSISQALSLERSGCDSSMDWSVFFLLLGGLSDCPTDPAGRDVRSGVSRTRLAFVRERPSTSGMQSLGGSPLPGSNTRYRYFRPGRPLARPRLIIPMPPKLTGIDQTDPPPVPHPTIERKSLRASMKA